MSNFWRNNCQTLRAIKNKLVQKHANHLNICVKICKMNSSIYFKNSTSTQPRTRPSNYFSWIFSFPDFEILSTLIFYPVPYSAACSCGPQLWQVLLLVLIFSFVHRKHDVQAVVPHQLIPVGKLWKLHVSYTQSNHANDSDDYCVESQQNVVRGEKISDIRNLLIRYESRWLVAWSNVREPTEKTSI